MPRGPKGERRPADVIGNAVTVMRIAVGEESDDIPTGNNKSEVTVEVSRLGGDARAKSLTAAKRKEIAKKAAKARWKKNQLVRVLKAPA